MTPDLKELSDHLTPIHLLGDSLTRTNCGLEAIDLPREQVTGLPRKATCQECKQRAINDMYRNFEQNTQPPIRGRQK